MPRRTDLVSEMLASEPRWLRWPLRTVLPVFRFARVIFALQAIGGAVAVVIGALTVNGKAALMGFVQLLLSGAVLGITLDSDTVIEQRGPSGEYVIRSGKRRTWHDARGLRRVFAFVRGDHVWRVAVRNRRDDPLGDVVSSVAADTEREALELAERLRVQIRSGVPIEDLEVPDPRQL